MKVYAIGLAMPIQYFRYDVEISVPYAALRGDGIRQVTNRDHRTGKHRDFKATATVEMNVEAGHGEAATLMKRARDPLRQSTRVMIVDIVENGNAGLANVRKDVLGSSASNQFADRLGARRITPAGRQRIHCLEQIIVDRDGDTLHGFPASALHAR